MSDKITWVLLALLVALGAWTWSRGGSEELGAGLAQGFRLFLRFAPLLVVSFLVAGLAERAIPTEWIEQTLGRDEGLRGLLIATGAGALTPAGPFVAMPIALGMVRAGAASSAVVAYLTGWSLLAVHRALAWELPILGPRLTLLRYGSCLALPIVAGLLARAWTRS